MAKLKGELQADNGDVLYPHTSSDVVFSKDGKSIEEQINVLSGGEVKNASEIGVTDANNLPIGWYSGNLTNSPTGDWATYHTFNKLGGSYKTQVAYGINNPFIEYRNYINGGYEKWRELSTTSKTDILPTPHTGFSISANESCLINNVVYINFCIDIPNAVPNTKYVVAKIVGGLDPINPVAVSVFRRDMHTGATGGIATDGNIVVETGNVASNAYTQYIVSGVYVL